MIIKTKEQQKILVQVLDWCLSNGIRVSFERVGDHFFARQGVEITFSFGKRRFEYTVEDIAPADPDLYKSICLEAADVIMVSPPEFI